MLDSQHAISGRNVSCTCLHERETLARHPTASSLVSQAAVEQSLETPRFANRNVAG